MVDGGRDYFRCVAPADKAKQIQFKVVDGNIIEA